MLQERYLLFANAGLLALLGGAYAVMDSRTSRFADLAVIGFIFLPPSATYWRSLQREAPAMEQAMAWLKHHCQAGDVVTASLPQTVNISKYYAQRAGFELDVRVYLTPVVEGGQPIHTTSLQASELLSDGPHQPPSDAGRWWRIDVQEQSEAQRDGWQMLARQAFSGPPGTREVAGSSQVTLKLYRKME